MYIQVCISSIMHIKRVISAIHNYEKEKVIDNIKMKEKAIFYETKHALKHYSVKYTKESV